jgi:hypothetical protein
MLVARWMRLDNAPGPFGLGAWRLGEPWGRFGLFDITVVGACYFDRASLAGCLVLTWA